MARTASTGVAAFNIGGQTIHSWLGIGWGEEDVKYLIEKVKKNKKAQDRIKRTNVLILDEVSMIKGDLMDKMDVILKYFRHSEKPFGGITLVLSGDPFQLAPVWKADEVRQFFFEGRSYREGEFKVIQMNKIVRQTDKAFIELLNRIRFGDVSDLSLLETRMNKPIPEGIKPVEIYCKNADVDRINKEKLAELKTPVKFYRCRDSGQPYHTDAFNKNCPAPEVLELKVGARVMLLVNENVKEGLVNGAIGTVRGFTTEGVSVQFDKDSLIVGEHQWEIKEQEVGISGMQYKVVATRRQIPLRVAWAVSAHKTQGCTFDHAYVDMSSAFSEGQIYTSLSRVRSLDGLYLTDFDPSRIKVDSKCLDFYRNLNKTEVDNW